MNFLVLFAIVAGAASSFSATAQNLERIGSTNVAPDRMLLRDMKSKWWADIVPAVKSVELKQRDPTEEEQRVIDRIRFLMKNHEGRAFALMDGDTVVYQEFKGAATEHSKFFGASMGKTVTSMAVGQAICAGALAMTTTAEEVLPELRDTYLGKSTVRDLLTMSSGTAEVNEDTTILTKEQTLDWYRGDLDLLAVLSSESVSRQQKGIFSGYKPGEHFAYQSTEPFTLGMMVARAVHMEFAKYVQENVIEPMGGASQGFYRQDRLHQPLSDSGLSIGLADWERFALWVQRSSRQPGCFGDYVRDSQKTQISNTSHKIGALFNGYGYLTWTENRFSRNSAWAVGYGGQRISWHKDSDRMIVVFSVMEDWMDEVYKLDDAWASIRSANSAAH